MSNIIRHAITRSPGPNFADGLTSYNGPPPDPEKALQQFSAYLSTLEKLGVEVMTLPCDPAYPDGCFVEDTAIVTDQGAVMTLPGHASRQGEVQAIAEALAPYRTLRWIKDPGRVGWRRCADDGRPFLHRDFEADK